MLVKDRMTANPVTITKQTTVATALELMQTNNFRRLPVMDGDKLIGIVTDRDLSKLSPSPATTLSAFEANYLLAKKMCIRDRFYSQPGLFSLPHRKPTFSSDNLKPKKLHQESKFPVQ